MYRGYRKMTDYKYLDNYMQLWKKYVQSADNVRTILNEAHDYLSDNQIEYFTELLARFEEKQELYYNKVINELTLIDDTEMNKDVKVHDWAKFHKQI